MKTIHITAIMPVKDRFELAIIAARAVCNQTYPVDEFIIVDDGSTERADVHLAEISILARNQGISLHFIRNDTSCGVSIARNLGAKVAKGKTLMFCDSDDYWFPQKVEIIRALMSKFSPDAIFIHAISWITGELWISKLLPKGICIRLPRWVLYLVGCLSPSCLCIPASTYQSGFNENIRYHEDLEFALRKSKEFPVVFYNSPLTVMGRPPFSAGGATSNSIPFRKGAITALKMHPGSGLEWIIGKSKILYHIFIIRLHNR